MTLKELTAKVAAVKEGRLVLLGARPTMGKTSVAMGIALELAAQGKKVNYFSCSEKPAFMKQHLEFINRGPLSEDVQANIVPEGPMAFKLEEIEALCVNQPDAVFIDTLQELDKAGKEFADLQKALKEMSAKLGCPVIVLSQLTDKIDKRLF